ncbi:MAG: hypothetical protein PVH87_28880, partial [Desulfobacteraceae bacterium]
MDFYCAVFYYRQPWFFYGGKVQIIGKNKGNSECDDPHAERNVDHKTDFIRFRLLAALRLCNPVATGPKPATPGGHIFLG